MWYFPRALLEHVYPWSKVFTVGLKNKEYWKISADFDSGLGQVRTALGKMSFYHSRVCELFRWDLNVFFVCHFTQTGVFSCSAQGNQVDVVCLQNAPLKSGVSLASFSLTVFCSGSCIHPTKMEQTFVSEIKKLCKTSLWLKMTFLCSFTYSYELYYKGMNHAKHLIQGQWHAGT